MKSAGQAPDTRRVQVCAEVPRMIAPTLLVVAEGAGYGDTWG